MRAVIAHSWLTRYSHLHTRKASRMTNQQKRAELEKRLEAGEWLPPGDVAIVLAISRSKATRMLSDGRIGFRFRPGSKYRVANPADVKRLLDESRQEHRGAEPPAVES